MAGPIAEKRFSVLCEIARAQHFSWREAVAELCPGREAEVVRRMWEITGRKTAEAYLKRIDRERPLPLQVAESVVWSSQCMGEDARVELRDGDPSAYVRHADCPWFHWHRRLSLLGEDRPGCDSWFSTLVGEINRALGTALRVETLGSLPDGDGACVRRFWMEGDA
ncbi:MAG: hypothetical protein Fur0037_28120 [Planctomycetota bacterium]